VSRAKRSGSAAEDKQPKSTTGRPDDDDVEWHRQAVEAKRLNARVDKLKKGVEKAGQEEIKVQ
jgi:hypothetical protein